MEGERGEREGYGAPCVLPLRGCQHWRARARCRSSGRGSIALSRGAVSDAKLHAQRTSHAKERVVRATHDRHHCQLPGRSGAA